MARTPMAHIPRLFRTQLESDVRIFFHYCRYDINVFGIIRDLYFILKRYVVCTHKNRLDETILMSTHNILYRKDEHFMLLDLAL